MTTPTSILEVTATEEARTTEQSKTSAMGYPQRDRSLVGVHTHPH